jgi:hypothetical protein
MYTAAIAIASVARPLAEAINGPGAGIVLSCQEKTRRATAVAAHTSRATTARREPVAAQPEHRGWPVQVKSGHDEAADLKDCPVHYAVVIEKGERNYSAYVSDLLGCVRWDTVEDVTAESSRQLRSHRSCAESLARPSLI